MRTMCWFFSFGDDFNELIQVEVPASFGFGFVFGVEEGAFGDEDLGVDDVGMVEDGADGGVAEVGEEGDFDGVLDFDAFFAEGGDLLAGAGR